MGSPFMYRLRVISSKKGQGRDQNVIPIFAFKGGAAQGGTPFPTEPADLNLFKRIALGADGARQLSVCTEVLYAYRALEEKDVEYFELHIKDTRVRVSPYEERRTVATITCKDMHGDKRIPVDRSRIQMSCEPMSNQLVAVTLSFWDYNGGPVFTQL